MLRRGEEGIEMRGGWKLKCGGVDCIGKWIARMEDGDRMRRILDEMSVVGVVGVVDRSIVVPDDRRWGRGGHQWGILNYPVRDSKYRNYEDYTVLQRRIVELPYQDLNLKVLREGRLPSCYLVVR